MRFTSTSCWHFRSQALFRIFILGSWNPLGGNTRKKKKATFNPKIKFRTEFVPKASDYCRVHLRKNKEYFCMEKKSECKRKHCQTEIRQVLPDNVLVVMRVTASRYRNAFSKPIIRGSKKSLGQRRTWNSWVMVASRFQPLSQSKPRPISRSTLKISIGNKSQNVEETENSVVPVVERKAKGMTEKSLMSYIRKRPFDGYRGYNPEGG
jgi:hypothetical protein